MDIKAKLRPFYVAKMLYEQTDEDHYLTIAQIMEQLEKDYGISTSRGTVGDDIKALQELVGQFIEGIICNGFSTFDSGNHANSHFFRIKIKLTSQTRYVETLSLSIVPKLK